jgi:hypothetical protein
MDEGVELVSETQEPQGLLISTRLPSCKTVDGV